jgi:hypothetical protein
MLCDGHATARLTAVESATHSPLNPPDFCEVLSALTTPITPRHPPDTELTSGQDKLKTALPEYFIHISVNDPFCRFVIPAPDRNPLEDSSLALIRI